VFSNGVALETARTKPVTPTPGGGEDFFGFDIETVCGGGGQRKRFPADSRHCNSAGRWRSGSS